MKRCKSISTLIFEFVDLEKVKDKNASIGVTSYAIIEIESYII